MIITEMDFTAKLEQYMKVARITNLYITDQNGEITWFLSGVKRDSFIEKLLDVILPSETGYAAEVPA